ncbi:MAG TPA: PHB depolymerase family esterase [Anaerolineales bacterium]|nr:PHB depolymerase family esterase [Anaerolineales bacterium]
MRSIARLGKALALGTLVLLGLLALAVLIIGAVFTWLDKTNGEIVSSGETRRYLLFVPTTYDPARPTPLVISLHGFVQWPANQMQTSQWNDLAEEFGFLVVYPEGTGFPRRWRAGGQAGGSSDPLADVVFISDLIDELELIYNIDPARIYANGISNGGGMSFLLGCALSDRIAAIGGVAGLYVYPLEACRPSRPVPMIALHGTADAIVPYLGGPSRGPEMQLPSIPEWMAARAKLNGCDATPTALPTSGEVSGIRYSDCDQGAEVDFYTIEGGGHTWPGGDPLPGWIAGPTSQDISATRVMWEFFSRFSLGDQP